MNVKRTAVVAGLLIGCVLAWGMESITFLKDGKKVTGNIVDMSSRTGNLQYLKHGDIHRSKIWMINYVDEKWNFPAERQQLPEKMDIIFLRNDTKMVGHIVDFSSRRQVWEFKDGRFVKEHRVRRIYFCCTRFPAFYRRLMLKQGGKVYPAKKIREDGQVRPVPKGIRPAAPAAGPKDNPDLRCSRSSAGWSFPNP